VTSFSEREIECLFDGKPIGQIETDGMQSRQCWYADWVAGSSPNFVSAGSEHFRNGEPDSGTGPGEKNVFHRKLRSFPVGG